MSPSMTRFHGFFCNVRQIFCSLHIFLIKKYFSVFSSIFDKTRQEQKSKNINRTLLHSETTEVWFECQKLRKNVTCVRSFYPISRIGCIFMRFFKNTLLKIFNFSFVTLQTEIKVFAFEKELKW
jgi:hypothetical protein